MVQKNAKFLYSVISKDRKICRKLEKSKIFCLLQNIKSEFQSCMTKFLLYWEDLFHWKNLFWDWEILLLEKFLWRKIVLCLQRIFILLGRSFFFFEKMRKFLFGGVQLYFHQSDQHKITRFSCYTGEFQDSKHWQQLDAVAPNSFFLIFILHFRKAWLKDNWYCIMEERIISTFTIRLKRNILYTFLIYIKMKKSRLLLNCNLFSFHLQLFRFPNYSYY